MRFAWLIRTISFLTLLAAWQLLALLAASDLLPSPAQVARVIAEQTRSGVLPYHLGATLARLAVSFLIAMTLGCAIGLWLGRNRQADRLFDAWLTIALNVPALVVIILCYVWFGLTEVAAVAAVVVNKVPNVAITLREGARALDRGLLEMAQVYRMSSYATLRHVVWPQLLPYISAAARTGLALIWKIILVVELLGRSNGMGYQLHLYFQLFDVAGILAYSVAFIAVVQVIEAVALRPLDRAAHRWRR